MSNQHQENQQENIPPSISRREALKRAGWTVPAIISVSLLNTATTMSGDHSGGHKGGGHKGGGHKGGGHKGGGHKGGGHKGGGHKGGHKGGGKN